ncbi:disintegrin and metalloproteinase domain-containing protein 10-like isoform X1 [Centruroides sculpturatus]|uniref:disintegrin and metalloproteinase domain-containing protein 10-like isoform X1 n=1 Tax=Centruroides sculpturatus TaxID=218467 RepID=UPI000C6D18C5|nr:disintegrin and metalloproteinase domain-containing protein 10-like isoform X1 [Centruroides sculpturatus]
MKLYENFKAESYRGKTTITVKFRAFNKNFELNLREDNSITSPSSKVFIVGQEIIKLYLKNVAGSSIYEGNVSGAEQSVVNGYLHQNGFIGKIKLNNEIYYTETASTYLKDAIYKDKLIIYKEVDILPIEYGSLNGSAFCSTPLLNNSVSTNLFDYNKIWRSDFFQKSAINKEKKLICNLEIMADHTFVNHFNGDRATILAEMFYYVKVADKIFRNLHLDKSDLYKIIGFNVEKITIIEDASNPYYHLNFNNTDDTEFLFFLGMTAKQTSCLFVNFSHRDFGVVLGNTYVGGVCSGSTEVFSSNVISITNFQRNITLSKYIVSLTLVHEIGHTFGSDHDPPNDTVCTPGKFNHTIGNYIMYEALETPEILYNHLKFSPCSERSMYDNLFVNNKAICMTKPKSICGNGITEQGEECDCGSIESCEKLDPCCNPPGSRAPCTLLKQSRNFCSPREGDCCNEKCEFFAKVEQRQCFVYTPCREKILYCNGLSPFCPEVILPDGTLCSGPNICKSGSCLVDVCKDNGLQLCKCPKSLECQICCADKEGNCKSTSDRKIFLPNRTIFAVFPGTPCNNNSGKCLVDGTCYSKYIPENWWNTFWPYLLPVPSFMTFYLCMFLYRYSKMKLLNFKF